MGKRILDLRCGGNIVDGELQKLNCICMKIGAEAHWQVFARTRTRISRQKLKRFIHITVNYYMRHTYTVVADYIPHFDSDTLSSPSSPDAVLPLIQSSLSTAQDTSGSRRRAPVSF